MLLLWACIAAFCLFSDLSRPRKPEGRRSYSCGLRFHAHGRSTKNPRASIKRERRRSLAFSGTCLKPSRLNARNTASTRVCKDRGPKFLDGRTLNITIPQNSKCSTLLVTLLSSNPPITWCDFGSFSGTGADRGSWGKDRALRLGLRTSRTMGLPKNPHIVP